MLERLQALPNTRIACYHSDNLPVATRKHNFKDCWDYSLRVVWAVVNFNQSSVDLRATTKI